MNNEDIKNLIQETLNKLCVETESIIEENMDGPSETLVFLVYTPEHHQLIGRDGEVFQALNHLMTRIAFAKDQETKRFIVDINGYHKECLEKIKQKAQFAADRARSFQTKIELEPMNSFERLMVHSLFPEGGDIQTHSEGVGRGRRIVLSYLGD